VLIGIKLCVTTGGQGPALILLHGFPQTHIIWHRVAPALAQQFTLVMPDLRGYGNSAAPAGDAGHRCYSKREMARDIVALADHLGFEHFALAGHDRGGRVAYRLVLDHPGRVSRFCAIDIVPTLDVWEEMDTAGSVSAFHWSLLATSAPLPEVSISSIRTRSRPTWNSTAIRHESMHSVKITVQVRPSTVISIRPTATPDDGWIARCC
jgi:haloacetate dehalogenase